MPGDPGATVVTTVCLLPFAHVCPLPICGCNGHAAFPHTVVLRLPSCSPVIGFLVTVVPKKLASQELDASAKASGPRDFAVRQINALVGSTARVHRIPPRVRDDRDTPLRVGRDHSDTQVIWVGGKSNYSRGGDWTGVK